MTEKKLDSLHVAIVGAGPVGIEAALAAAEAGVAFTLYEAGARVGNNVLSWGHVELFTGWDLNVSPRMRRWLRRAGREIPSGGEPPTGRELVRRVLQPIAALPAVGDRLRLGTRVLSVAREGLLKHEEIASAERANLPFRLLVRASDGERIDRADMVVDCTGTWDVPNALGEGGIPAPGEAGAEDRIVRHIPDIKANPGEWAGKRILLVGGGHSAQTVARSLAVLAQGNPATRV
ncbi:MAG: FAD-dependent oxidoreductase, partial [Gammaproteobacteria bacterium]|nr:FAD-dependent oxidoreductase [Gammaproteobacteria bacterium]